MDNLRGSLFMVASLAGSLIIVLSGVYSLMNPGTKQACRTKNIATPT